MIRDRILDILTWPFRPRSIPFHHPAMGWSEAAVVSRLLPSRVGRRRIVRSVTGFVDANSALPPPRGTVEKMLAALDAVSALEPGVPGLTEAYAAVRVWEVMSS